MLIVDTDKCCGCGACAEICPEKCIFMKRDAEGFLYPDVLENKLLCVDCGLCEKVCPLINGAENSPREEKGCIVQITDEKIRRQSTSGGAFTAIAETIIAHGGIVYGATYNQDYKVVHTGVNTKKELWKFRNSKYVQSDLHGVFPEIKSFLEEGKIVCFSGTPCQIEGLKCYLGKEYDNLFTVNVVCHGISSPLLWEKYLELNKESCPEWIFFRDKHYGYKYSTMTFVKDGKKIYSQGVETDPMLRAYFTNNCDRRSCYQCEFKKRYCPSDFTIWDCYHPEFYNKTFNDDRGTTSMLINSDKGRDLYKDMLENGIIRAYEVSPDELTFGNNEMINSVKPGDFRESLLADAAQMDAKSLFEKYFPITFKSKIKKVLRIMLVKLGIYNKLKYALFCYRRQKFKRNV